MEDLFKQLPSPHKENCTSSIPDRYRHSLVSSINTALLLLDLDCGYAPQKYYEDLYRAVQARQIELIDLTYDDVKRN